MASKKKKSTKRRNPRATSKFNKATGKWESTGVVRAAKKASRKKASRKKASSKHRNPPGVPMSAWPAGKKKSAKKASRKKKSGSSSRPTKSQVSVFAKAIAKDPDNRYRDAAQMAADLRSSLGQPPRRRPLSVLSQGPAPASGAGTGGGGSRRTEDVTGGGNTSTTTVSLSGAFDSSAATLRLTAIANEGGSVIGSAPFPQAANTGSMASAEARQRADRVAKITPWLWLGSLVALGLAAYLFVR